MVWTGSLSELIHAKSLGYCLVFSKCFVNVSYRFFIQEKLDPSGCPEMVWKGGSECLIQR